MPRPGARVPGAFGPFARALECHYGCTRAQVAFWDVHEQAAREHSAIADHIVVRFGVELRFDLRKSGSPGVGSQSTRRQARDIIDRVQPVAIVATSTQPPRPSQR